MDKEGNGTKQNRFSWLPDLMPGVAKLIAEKRARYGNEHVNRCWRLGVLEQQAGWFFAREGALAVGTPWVVEDFTLNVTPTQALLVIREPEVANAA